MIYVFVVLKVYFSVNIMRLTDCVYCIYSHVVLKDEDFAVGLLEDSLLLWASERVLGESHTELYEGGERGDSAW